MEEVNLHNCLENSKVIDGKRINGKRNKYIKRRRECLTCKKRFSTAESVIDSVLTEREQAEHKDLLIAMVKGFEKKLTDFKGVIEKL